MQVISYQVIRKLSGPDSLARCQQDVHRGRNPDPFDESRSLPSAVAEPGYHPSLPLPDRRHFWKEIPLPTAPSIRFAFRNTLRVQRALPR